MKIVGNDDELLIDVSAIYMLGSTAEGKMAMSRHSDRVAFL